MARQRRASDDLYNMRRKMRREAESLRKQAKNKNLRAEERKKLQQEARNITKRADRLTARGKSDEQVRESIAIQTLKLEGSREYTAQMRRNAMFRYEVNRARDEQPTSTFGEDGAQARMNVTAFISAYKRDWQGEDPRNRLEAIAKREHMDLYTLYDQFMNSEKQVGDEVLTYHEFLARKMSIGTSNVDTRDPVWQASVEQSYRSLSSPQQQAISAAWAAYKTA